MRKVILIMTIALICTFAYSQDKIFTHRGDSILCKVIEIGEKSIKYNYEGEELTYTISKNPVSEIKFASGRTQVITEKVIVTSELDWEKVIITNSETDVEGLIRVDEIMSKVNSGWNFTNQGRLQKEAMDKLKKEAAGIKCHIVLILTTTGSEGGYGTGAKASVTGVAYKY